MYCKHCGKEISETAKFCDGCGKPVVEEIKIEPASNKATEKTKKKKSIFKKWWFWLIAIILIIGSCGGSDTESEDYSSDTEENTDYSISAKEEFAEDFCEESGLSQETADKIYDLLVDQLLCRDVSFYQKSEVGNVLWEINTSDYLLSVSADDNGIYSVRCGSFEMYDGSDVILTYEDILDRDPSEHRSAYAVIAKNIVESSLKAPSTAEFQDSWDFAIQKNGDLVAVSGYVDAQNSFGAMIRNDFIVEFRVIDIDNFTYETVFIQIGDETAGEFISLS